MKKYILPPVMPGGARGVMGSKTAEQTRDKKQTTYISSTAGWSIPDFPEIWTYRELFLFLTLRDFRLRYKQTLLGPIWAIIMPVLQMIVFATIFGKLAKLQTDGLPGPVFYFTGLVIWRYFAAALQAVCGSLVQSSNIFTKVYFPRLIIPMSRCVISLGDFAISLLILLLLLWGYSISLSASAFFLPILVLLAMGAAFGFGTILSCINVKFRDVGVMVSYLTQMWMYITIIVPFSEFSLWATNHGFGKWKYLYGLNPMAGVVEGFRWCLLHSNMKIVHVVDGQTVRAIPDAPWQLMAIGAGSMIFVLLVSLVYFKRTERSFADVV
jgi:lipopolysaccharide transport system permease protein